MYTDRQKINRHDSLMTWLEQFKKDSKTRSEGHIVHNVIREIESSLEVGTTCYLPSKKAEEDLNDLIDRLYKENEAKHC